MTTAPSRQRQRPTSPIPTAESALRSKDNVPVKPLLAYLKTLGTLQMALGVSLALHAALLAVRFVNPDGFNRVFKDTPLEVILVNAEGGERPDKAMAIAQASLAGGGEADKGRATSPLPLSAVVQIGDTTNEDERQIGALKEQQSLLLAQVRKQLANMPAPEAEAVDLGPPSAERQVQRQALVEMLAEIEKRINEESARPKKRDISPATQEAAYAIYQDALRRRIEKRGTSNFPTASGRKLYGELTMVITVNFTGEVLQTEVVQSSGQPVLDRRAQAIVSGMNHGRFSDAMRRQADQIVVVSRFRFTRDATLRTQLSNP
jgi:protein TonB